MHFTLKKRTAIRLISFLLAAFTALFGLALKQSCQIQTLQRDLTHDRQQMLESLNESLEGMTLTLEKSLYVGTPAGMSSLTNKLILLSGNAGAALSKLPSGNGGVQTVAKFLSQVSDYAAVLTEKCIRGEEITTAEYDTLRGLYESAQKLSAKTDELKTLYGNYNDLKNSLNGEWATAAESAVSSPMEELDRSLGEQPALIYDGPFSDHISKQSSALLQQASPVTKEQAAKKSAELLGLKEGDLQALEEEQGSMPAYCFKAEKTRIAITKNGGYLSYFTNGRVIGTAALESKDAPQKAKEFLLKLGLGNFQSSYYFTDEGICTVNFCYKQGNILCYTDLIKIGVALDNGQIVSCEARGFIMNHKARTVQAAKLTAAQAQAVLSKKLQPVSTNWCLIPSEGKEELYCYEFYCRGQKGEDVLVYINAQTGAEEQLLILLKTDGGTLTR